MDRQRKERERERERETERERERERKRDREREREREKERERERGDIQPWFIAMLDETGAGCPAYGSSYKTSCRISEQYKSKSI